MIQTRLFSSTNDNIEDDIDENSSNSKIFFDIAIISPTNKNDQIPLGRLTFQLTPPSNPAYLPLHTQNLINLASGTRRSVDPKATYIGCPFAYSPAFIQDGSFRYKWGHECDGFGRNAIQVATTRNSGKLSGWDETFSDPERLKDCTHKSFGGVYYGMRYQDVVDTLSKQTDGEAQAVLLTVPINGPKSGTSKFSMVRVSESPREWGERLLLNSAVIGYLDCGADGTLVGDDGSDENEKVKPLDVLRAMAQQKVGIPTIINCGVL